MQRRPSARSIEVRDVILPPFHRSNPIFVWALTSELFAMTATSIDLSPYVAKGFPGKFDEAIAKVGVAGIDKEQAQTMVRVCAETEATLYGPDFSPTKIRYRKGSRPVLEKIVAQFRGRTAVERATEAMHWVASNVVHPHLAGPMAPDRAMTEEQLIASRTGWCNEQTRVFIALAEVMEIPARLCFVFHENNVCGHTCAEAWLESRWAYVDVTFTVIARLPDGRLAEGRDLSGPYRALAHKAYRPSFEAYYARVLPYVEGCPGWCSKDRPTLDRGGDLMAYLGITNYLIQGVEVD
jgi:transglutaminase-like putative cysteine protease